MAWTIVSWATPVSAAGASALTERLPRAPLVGLPPGVDVLDDRLWRRLRRRVGGRDGGVELGAQIGEERLLVLVRPGAHPGEQRTHARERLGPLALAGRALVAVAAGVVAGRVGREAVGDGLYQRGPLPGAGRSEEHTSELQSRAKLVC